MIKIRILALTYPDICGEHRMAIPQGLSWKTNVKKLNLKAMYELGQRLVPLRSIQWKTKLDGVLAPLWFAKNELEVVASPGSPLLEVTKRAARVLIAAITEIVPEDPGTLTDAEKERELGYEGYKIHEAFEAFESVLSNETPSVPAYIVSQKGIYRTEDLIEHADKHFPSEIAEMLPLQTKTDICESGKCLAFELPTACSFHLWRALETVMDSYYARITSSSFEQDKVSLNWGAKIKALEEQGADKAVTKNLDHIREHYRNPQTHPDEIVTLDEAQMLFGTAASSITQMVMAMRKLAASPPGGLSALSAALMEPHA